MTGPVPRRGWRWSLSLAGLLAMVSVGVAACGGSSAKSSTVIVRLGGSSGAPPATTPTVRQQPLTPQKVAVVRAARIRAQERARKLRTLPRATAPQSTRALTCLRGAGLGPVAASTSYLWEGFATKTGGWVYVQLYKTAAAAAGAARALSPQETATSGVFMVHQPITRYSGSPVPAVATCLTTGRPTKPAPARHHHKARFVF